MNLMLNVSTQPVKVLQHMYEVSAPGCILGISVWGNKANSTFLVLFEKAREHFGIEEDPRAEPIPSVQQTGGDCKRGRVGDGAVVGPNRSPEGGGVHSGTRKHDRQ